MIEKIEENISVNFTYNHILNKLTPGYLKWKNQLYKLTKLGLHYTLYRGTTLIHMFSVCDDIHYFLLSFNTKTLEWRLEEIAEE